MRLDKLFVYLKYGSRKEIQLAAKKQRITVNGEIVKDPSFKVDPNKDVITLDDEVIVYKENVLLMLHKPQDYVCSNKDGLHKTVFDLIEEPYSRLKLNIAGRLDIDTEGLVLLTDNGELLHELISPNKNIYKTYLVRTAKPIKAKKLDGDYEILDGRNLPYKPLKPFIEQINEYEFYISIKEGKFHQVKRMVQHFSNEVIYLKRIAFGDIELGELEIGKYREL